MQTLKHALRNLNKMHYGGNKEKVVLAHDKLTQLQRDALSSPSSLTFDAIAAQETVLSELSVEEEAFFKQKSRVIWSNEGD